MDDVKEKVKTEITKLYDEGVDLFYGEFAEEIKTDSQPKKARRKKSIRDSISKPQKKLPFAMGYQQWYSKSLPVVRQVLPERYQEFQEQYKLDKRKEINFLSYTIGDYLIGLSVKRLGEEVVNPRSALAAKFQHQLTILYSALERIDSILSDIEGVLQAGLFTEELEAAEDLLKKKHLRAAGTLAGVTLEAHLARVCGIHLVKFQKKSLTIGDYNDALKNERVVDTATWRRIQTLGDIRNLCAHKREREPTQVEVQDLVNGVRVITGSIF